jgi:hypothetical protein
MNAQEDQRIPVSFEPVEEEKENVLELMFHFYDDVPEKERQEIEKIVLDRRDFFGDRHKAVGSHSSLHG